MRRRRRGRRSEGFLFYVGSRLLLLLFFLYLFLYIFKKQLHQALVVAPES